MAMAHKQLVEELFDSAPVAVALGVVATLGLSHLSRMKPGVTAYQFFELCVLLYICVPSAALWVADPRPVTERTGWVHFAFITTSYLLAERVILGILLERQSVLSLLPPRTYQCKLMYERGFTRVTIFFFLASATHRQACSGPRFGTRHGRAPGALLYNLLRVCVCHMRDDVVRVSQALEDVYGAATVASWSSIVVFNAVLCLDSSAHRRLAAHVGLPFAAFSVGNLIVHGLPCLIAAFSPPARLMWWHGVMCVVVHLIWGWCWTGGTFLLDNVYAPLAPAVWRGMWAFALVFELLLPCWMGS